MRASPSKLPVTASLKMACYDRDQCWFLKQGSITPADSPVTGKAFSCDSSVPMYSLLHPYRLLLHAQLLDDTSAYLANSSPCWHLWFNPDCFYAACSAVSEEQYKTAASGL